MTRTARTALISLGSVAWLLLCSAAAHAEPLPTASDARQDAVDSMADVLSEGIWTQEQAGRIAETRVEVSAPMSYRLASVWCQLSTYGEDDVCEVTRVATPAGARWVGVLTAWTE